MNKIILIIFLILFLTSCSSQQFVFLSMPNNQTVKVKLSITDSQHAKGLSQIEKLIDYEGMLFVFKEPKQVSFWMKDVKFPLDIIYLNENKQIQEIFFNVPVCENECTSIISESNKIKYVIELAGNKSLAYDLNVGSIINW